MRGDLPRGRSEALETFTKQVERMRARAVWSRIRYFTPQKRIQAARETRSLRSLAVVRTALAEALTAPFGEARLAEEWAVFAIRLLEMLPIWEISSEQREERLGEAYTILGNARRISGNFQGASAAIETAYKFLEGRVSEAFGNLLSIHASLSYDTGNIEGAVDRIAQSRQIFSALRDRYGIARLGIQHANYLVEVQPDQARAIAADALVVLPRNELRLEMLARCIISECLAEARDGQSALVHLDEARPLLSQFREEWIDCRVQYLEARILDVLGYIADAERLYREVARLFWFREMYRESFMVRLRLFEFYLGRNRAKEAAEVCCDAVKLIGETNAHAQMKEVWQTLYEAAEVQAVAIEVLPKIRDYMVRHWTVPAEHPPAIAA